MTVINTNISATLTANALTKNERAMGQTMERLSTGLRINSAADDAAGLAISSKMTSQINGLNQAVRNSNDAISMLQTADGAAIEITNMLQRMRELSVQAATGTNHSTDVANLNTEFTALLSSIDAIANNTEWNGKKILNGTEGATGTVATTNKVITFHVGANASQILEVDFGDWNVADGDHAALADSSKGVLGADFTLAGKNEITEITIAELDTAIAGINTRRATYGAAINRLEYTVDNLTNVSQNTAASRSRIQDADYAAETTELARTQIIQQAGTAMLSQANQQAQSVLALLK
jgi:flagellin